MSTSRSSKLHRDLAMERKAGCRQDFLVQGNQVPDQCSAWVQNQVYHIQTQEWSHRVFCFTPTRLRLRTRDKKHGYVSLSTLLFRIYRIDRQMRKRGLCSRMSIRQVRDKQSNDSASIASI